MGGSKSSGGSSGAGGGSTSGQIGFPPHMEAWHTKWLGNSTSSSDPSFPGENCTLEAILNNTIIDNPFQSVSYNDPEFTAPDYVLAYDPDICLSGMNTALTAFSSGISGILPQTSFTTYLSGLSDIASSGITSGITISGTEASTSGMIIASGSVAEASLVSGTGTSSSEVSASFTSGSSTDIILSSGTTVVAGNALAITVSDEGDIDEISGSSTISLSGLASYTDVSKITESGITANAEAYGEILDENIEANVLPRLKVGMRNIGAINSSSFVLASSEIEISRNRDLAKYYADLKLSVLKENTEIDKFNEDKKLAVSTANLNKDLQLSLKKEDFEIAKNNANANIRTQNKLLGSNVNIAEATNNTNINIKNAELTNVTNITNAENIVKADFKNAEMKNTISIKNVEMKNMLEATENTNKTSIGIKNAELATNIAIAIANYNTNVNIKNAELAHSLRVANATNSINVNIKNAEYNHMVAVKQAEINLERDRINSAIEMQTLMAKVNVADKLVAYYMQTFSLKEVSTKMFLEYNRMKIVSKGEELNTEMTLRTSEALWQLQSFQHAGNFLGAIGSGIATPQSGYAPSRSSSAIGGALSGVVGGAMAFPENPVIGGAVGGVLGLASGLF